MLAVKQKENKFNEIFFEVFKENKIEIAQAIPKLFPFLESLRDRCFITDRIYDDSYEACRNLVPVEAVVYNVLNHLETLPDCSFLCTLFNTTNLQAYPGLREIHKNLETGADDSCSQGSLIRTPSDFSLPDGAIQPVSRKRLSMSPWGMKSKDANTDHSIFHSCECHRTDYECAQAGTNLCLHENCTQHFYMKPMEKSMQNPMQNQENEVIEISSESSEDSYEDNENELLELFTWTPGLRSQREEEGEDRKAFFRKPCLLFPESPLLGDIEELGSPFSAPHFL